MKKVEQQLADYAAMIEQTLPAYLPQSPQPEQRVADAMGYSLLGGGKRVRGALVLAFYRLFRQDVAPALPFAGALEMVHAYSLIHDDLPCMDDDDLRRGKPSCHIAFDEATALLAGDGLLNLAFETMSDPANRGPFDGETLLRAVGCLSQASGVLGMIGGQMIDLFQEGKPADEALLIRTYAKKTGALIRAGGRLGCILGGGDEAAVEAADRYCEQIGLAFQIVDDILDIEGDAALLGKPIGSDADNDKNTYAAFYGVEAARTEVSRCNARAKEALAALGGDTAFLAGLADLLAGRRS